jgi:hypothetical protein
MVALEVQVLEEMEHRLELMLELQQELLILVLAVVVGNTLVLLTLTE